MKMLINKPVGVAAGWEEEAGGGGSYIGEQILEGGGRSLLIGI